MYLGSSEALKRGVVSASEPPFFFSGCENCEFMYS